jgi:hypothetical protein
MGGIWLGWRLGSESVVNSTGHDAVELAGDMFLLVIPVKAALSTDERLIIP